MTKWKAPEYIRKMRDEGKASKPQVRRPERSVTSAKNLPMTGGTRLTKVARKTPSLILKVIGLILTFVGVYGLFSSFASVTAGDPLNQSALSAPFTLTNTSPLFVLTSVVTTCDASRMKYRNAVDMSHNLLVGYEFDIPELPRGNQDTIYCENGKIIRGFGGPVTADITIRVKYGLGVYLFSYLVHLPLLRKETSARFITASTSEGKVKWLPYGEQDRGP